MPGGVAKTFIPTREPALKDPFDEWLARVVCFAFSISPQPFVAQVNRATAETAQDAALAEGLLPLKTWVKQLCDLVIAREFSAPDLEFVWSDDQPSDPEKIAAVAVDYVKAGIKSVNEVRAELGLDPVPGGDRPAVETAQGAVPLGAAPDVRSQHKGSKPAAPAHEPFARFNPNHYGPGPNGGQFAPAGAGGSDGGAAPTSPEPIQVAGGGDEDESGARRSMGEEFVDPEGPVRLALFQSAQAKLSALDPANPQARQILVGPDWVPKPDDLNAVQDALDRAIENRAADIVKHAYDKHVNDRNEFPGIASPLQLRLLAQDVMKTSPAEIAADGSVFFYQASTNTLVIVDPDMPERSTIFRPPDGRAYVDRAMKAKERR